MAPPAFATGLAQFAQRRRADPSHERLERGQLVWLPQDGVVFRPAKVKRGFDRGTERGGVVIYKEQGKLREIEVDEHLSNSIIPMGRENLQCLGHLGPELPDLSVAALFHNLRLRFEMGYNFLTVCDNILIFLNAEFETDILTLSMLTDTEDDGFDAMGSSVLADLDPAVCRDNLSTIVGRAFKRLLDSSGRQSQSIVVNGCEGSGKRDITRFVLMRAIQLAKPKNADWWQKLLAGDLLLQEFGGTNGYVRWTELQLFFGSQREARAGWLGATGGRVKNQSAQIDGAVAPDLLGAVYNAFGLDQARVTDPDQPLFPVFESLAVHAKLDANKYHYLHRDAKGRSSPRAWTEVIEAMTILGLSQSTRDQIQHVLMGILDTGSLQFAEVPDGDDEEEMRAREAELERAMGDSSRPVLGVMLGDLRNALKIKTIHVKNETFEKERNLKEKYAVRDGLARVIYSFLFDWIISCVNNEVSRIDEVVQNVKAAEAAAAEGPRPSKVRTTGASTKSSASATAASDSNKKKKKKKKKARPVGETEAEAKARRARNAARKEEKRKEEEVRAAAEKAAAADAAKRAAEEEAKANGASARLEQKKTKGTIGIVGVLENAALVIKESTLEDLYQNYRLERFHSFLSQSVMDQNSFNMSEKAHVRASIEYLASNEDVLRLFLGSVQDNWAANHTAMGRTLKKATMSRNVAARYLFKRISATGKRVSRGKRLSGVTGPSRSPLGVLQQIEEEIFLPGGSDRALARKVVRKAKYNKTLVRTSTTDFVVSHFGADITYNLEGFVDRSRANMIPVQVLKLLRERSSIPLVRQVVAFRRDPIGQSGVMGKRELESMLELDNKAVEDAVAAAADPSEETNGQRRGNSEMAKRIFNEMNRAVAILGRTEVEFIFSLAANGNKDPDAGLDATLLLSQLRQIGLEDAVCHRLYASIRGNGIAANEFVKRYAIIENMPSNSPPDKLCMALIKSGVMVSQWALNDDKSRVFITASAYFALETALRLLQHDAAALIQRKARRAFLA